MDDKNEICFSEWDVVDLSKTQTFQVYHSSVANLFTNNAVITPGFEKEIGSIQWQCFKDSNDNSIDNSNIRDNNSNQIVIIILLMICCMPL